MKRRIFRSRPSAARGEPLRRKGGSPVADASAELARSLKERGIMGGKAGETRPIPPFTVRLGSETWDFCFPSFFRIYAS